MILNKLFFNILLYITLILINETASFSEENSENNTSLTTAYRLPNYIIPYYYTIRIRLWLYYKVAEATHFFGDCHVYIKIHRPTHRISFHAQKPQINVNYVILKKNTNESEEKIHYISQNRTYNSKSHILNFYFIKEIPSGDYIFNINYNGSLNNENIFKNVYVNTEKTRWLYAMHFQATGARQIFPCWDEPEFKAHFNISIQHHKEYKVLSNMYYKTKTDIKETKIQWTHFNITPEISTYHVAICLLPDKWFKLMHSFYYRNQTNNATMMMNLSKIIVWNRNYSQITFAKEVIEKALISFKNDWKNLEEIPEIQFVLIPGFPYNNIEKWGLILNKETDIIYDKNVDSFSHKIEVTSLITRQMAHQWIGNLVSPSWWSHYWLNQGIATLLGIDILHKNFADFRMPDLFVVQMQQESLRLDVYSIMEPLMTEINKPTEINSLFSFPFYIKAPAILRMLKCVLSDQIFNKGIEKFYKTQSATLDNFYDVMQTIYDTEKKSYMKNFIIKDMMNAWMKQKHYPVLKVQTVKSYNLTNASYFILIEIENYDSLDLEYNWWIPITVTKQTELNFTIPTIWHAPKSLWIEVSQPTHVSYNIHNFSVEKNEWYIINLQQMGYYRVNYGEKNWKNIARYLTSINYMNIHVLNRAQIIDDAYHFMMEGTLNFFIFLELTEYLSQETDYVAWYPMFKALEDISRTFPFQNGKVNYFKGQILNSLNELLKNINYDKKPNEKPDDLIDCLRQEASKWACILDLSNCLKAAETKLHQHLANPETNILLPWWRHWTFCNGLRANRNMWKKARRIHLDNPYLISSKFLTCSNNPNIIKNYTNILFHELNNKMIYNHLNDIHYIIANHANNNEIFDNILKNLIKIPRKYVIVLLIDIINHVYSEKQLDKIQTFVDIFKEGVTIENVLNQQPFLDKFTEILTVKCVTNIDRLMPSRMKKIQPIITSMITDVIGYSLIIDKLDIRRSEISIHFAPFTHYIQF